MKLANGNLETISGFECDRRVRKNLLFCFRFTGNKKISDVLARLNVKSCTGFSFHENFRTESIENVLRGVFEVY